MSIEAVESGRDVKRRERQAEESSRAEKETRKAEEEKKPERERPPEKSGKAVDVEA